MRKWLALMILTACSAQGLPLWSPDPGSPAGPTAGAPDLALGPVHDHPDLAVPTDLGVPPDLALRDFAGTPDLMPACSSIGAPSHAATQISAGGDAVCAVVDGGARCWGRGWSGQLGDGSYNSSHVPVDVMGLSSGVASVSAGDARACAVTTAGAVKCWGTDYNYDVPVDVTGLPSGAVAVSAGGDFSCAVTSAGAVWCWGHNNNGELGDGTTTDSDWVPVAVSGLSSGVVAVAAGDFHACAITSAGGVECWGANNFGQLGNNSTADSPVPVGVVGLSSGVVAITAGVNHTCAVTSAGAAKCWGSNYYGELGNPASDGKLAADVVGLSSGVVGISAGNLRTCALTSAGAVSCWGAAADQSLVNATDVPVAAPCVPSGINAITVGNLVTCARTVQGAVECWGSNANGALGNDSTVDSPVPVEVVGL